MPKLRLTPEALHAIRAAAEHGFHQTAVLRPDGDYDVPFEEDTVERISAHMLEGESASDTILRIIATVRHGAN